MRTEIRTKVVGAMAGAFLLAVGATSYAGQNTLPNGRPFQILQQQIDELEAQLHQQIADLQGQIDALAVKVAANTASIEELQQHDALQDQLIGSLQAAVGMLEQRMAGAEASIDDLNAWNALQDQLLANHTQRINSLQSQVNSLQSQVNSQGGAINALFNLHNQQASLINTLFNLHNAQQSAINFLQGAINFLLSQNSTQNSQIASLQGQLNSLQSAYLTTRSQLASGCPPNTSIRQVIPFSFVVCEPDTGRAVVQQFSSGFSVGPLGIVSRDVFCPPVANFAATGGGASVSPAGVILETRPNGNGWRATVRSTTPFSFLTATVFVQCTTIVQ